MCARATSGSYPQLTPSPASDTWASVTRAGVQTVGAAASHVAHGFTRSGAGRIEWRCARLCISAMAATSSHGRSDAVCTDLPRVCASSRCCTSLVTPVSYRAGHATLRRMWTICLRANQGPNKGCRTSDQPSPESRAKSGVPTVGELEPARGLAASRRRSASGGVSRRQAQAESCRTAGRSAAAGWRRALAGKVATATVLPAMSKNSTE